MRDQELVNKLREHAEWARANEWETPITLGDDLVEAADRIANQSTHVAALQKEIEKLRAQVPGWIPVEERLPKDRSDVLVVAYWHERWGVYMGWCAPERAQWSVHIGIGDRNDVAVTHWMPLPEPPEEET
nr:MAG TPA: Protein of unknown function (DUF551) [Caudoviricetes sp.]